ncbi:MAG: phospho-sugar mutase, partial [Bacilli bacterium]|nr:phospho-sugar mutase [Bacilli bacterium]
MSVTENMQRWLNSPRVSEEDKKTIRSMDEETRNDAFYKNVEFGTAGMRGILGPGTNRINYQTIGRANVAYAKYILSLSPEAKKRGIVISHDNRFFSREFTLFCAKQFNDMGIDAYIFDGLRPTPELSFAVRQFHAIGGVM